MTNEEKRRDRVNRIIETLKKADQEGKVLEEKSFIARTCLELGLSIRMVREYLNLLETAKKIKRQGGEVWLI